MVLTRRGRLAAVALVAALVAAVALVAYMTAPATVTRDMHTLTTQPESETP